jgi:hypothetical protein
MSFTNRRLVQSGPAGRPHAGAKCGPNRRSKEGDMALEKLSEAVAMLPEIAVESAAVRTGTEESCLGGLLGVSGRTFEDFVRLR